MIFREGDPPTCAYLIDAGRVEVATEQGGKRLVLSYLGPGDLLGEMAMIDDAPRSAEARALTEVVAIEIRRDQIQERLQEADPILRSLVLGLLQRYRSGLNTLRGRARAPAVNTGPVLTPPPAANKFKLESQLIEALENDALGVLFQPVYDVRSGRVVGFEALTRWHHPERGPISPAEFIALAEETSLIVPVGQYALRKACEALTGLDSAAHRALWIGVNVSARQLAVPDFVDLLLERAERQGVDPTRIKLEITESLTLDYKHVAAMIQRCHAAGLQVALDDFGTGYSSLGHLHQLHFDVVKIDQALTRSMFDDPRSGALMNAIIATIHAIGAEAVVEGVERLEQARELAQRGVRYLQGWLIGKPAPVDELGAIADRVRVTLD